MLIVIDKNTKEIINNMGTNSMCPDGNLPYEPKETEELIRFHDDSDEAKLIMSAHEYEIDNGKVTVIKTKDQWQEEQPEPVKEETEIEKLTKRVEAIEKKLDKSIKA